MRNKNEKNYYLLEIIAIVENSMKNVISLFFFLIDHIGNHENSPVKSNFPENSELNTGKNNKIF